MKTVVEIFGRSLDKDDFETTRSVLHESCEYVIGETVLKGPDKIAASYESNMIAGRKKMDNLEWGESWVEELSANLFYVHFTDYLTHKNKTYVFRCKQKVETNNNKIVKIEHVHVQSDVDQLNAFYRSVGIPKTK